MAPVAPPRLEARHIILRRRAPVLIDFGAAPALGAPADLTTVLSEAMPPRAVRTHGNQGAWKDVSALAARSTAAATASARYRAAPRDARMRASPIRWNPRRLSKRGTTTLRFWPRSTRTLAVMETERPHNRSVPRCSRSATVRNHRNIDVAPCERGHHPCRRRAALATASACSQPSSRGGPTATPRRGALAIGIAVLADGAQLRATSLSADRNARSKQERPSSSGSKSTSSTQARAEEVRRKPRRRPSKAEEGATRVSGLRPAQE